MSSVSSVKGRSVHTAKTIFNELSAIRIELKKARSGYRGALYNAMQEMQRQIVRLEANQKLRREFTKRVRKDGRVNHKFNLTTEVVALATGAKSRAGRQLAWKRGRVLDYLRERENVKAERTARAIRRGGGIERLFNLSTVVDKTTVSPTRDEKVVQPPSSSEREITVPVWIKKSDCDQILGLTVGTRIKLTAIRVGQKAADIRINRIIVND